MRSTRGQQCTPCGGRRNKSAKYESNAAIIPSRECSVCPISCRDIANMPLMKGSAISGLFARKTRISLSTLWRDYRIKFKKPKTIPNTFRGRINKPRSLFRPPPMLSRIRSLEMCLKFLPPQTIRTQKENQFNERFVRR